MPKEIRTVAFKKSLKKILKKFQKSEDTIKNAIDEFCENPERGDTCNWHKYLGLPEDVLKVKKERIGLPEYNIGKSNGLRVIILHVLTKDTVVCLSLYYKKEHRSEEEVRSNVKSQLKDVLEELKNSN